MSSVAPRTRKGRLSRPGPGKGKKREQQRAWLWVLLFLTCGILTAVLALSLGQQSGASAAVPRSAQRRSRLETGSVRESSYVTDRLGWLEENRRQAESGLKYFYDKTGVQPHIYLRNAQNQGAGDSRENMDSYSSALYGSLFSDERHLLIVVEEQENGSLLRVGLAPGRQAQSVMDPEALEILLAYWNILLEDSQDLAGGQKASAIGETLKKTADNIMRVRNSGSWIWLLGILIGGILLIGAWEFRKNWMRLKSEENSFRD